MQLTWGVNVDQHYFTIYVLSQPEAVGVEWSNWHISEEEGLHQDKARYLATIDRPDVKLFLELVRCRREWLVKWLVTRPVNVPSLLQSWLPLITKILHGILSLFFFFPWSSPMEPLPCSCSPVNAACFVRCSFHFHYGLHIALSHRSRSADKATPDMTIGITEIWCVFHSLMSILVYTFPAHGQRDCRPHCRLDVHHREIL